MMQEIEFVKFNPTENMTVLVKTRHRVDDYHQIASRLMAYDSLHAEQVGFMEEAEDGAADAALVMAGGEFCGNACMSLAAFIASQRSMPHGDSSTILMQVSGTDELVSCEVENEMGVYRCTMTIPVPTLIQKQMWVVDGEVLAVTMIHYQEAVHAVLEAGPMDPILRRSAEALARTIRSSYEGKLVGVLLYDAGTSELSPLIHVPELGSMVWERGCGSGTGSLGAYLAWKQDRSMSARVKQPGGEMHVSAEWDEGSITSVRIEGTVGIVAEGKAFIMMNEEEVAG